MHALSIRALVLVAILCGGCLTEVDGEPSESASLLPSTPSAAVLPSPSAVERRTVPPGFPVLPGAVAVDMPADDPGLIGLWESDQLGSAAYDFYVTALPAAGYPIVGLYPGGDVALIRFAASGGEIWQMVAHGATNGRAEIEVRLDRP